MDMALLGINHTQSEIKRFEPIFLNRDGKQRFRQRLLASKYIQECVILTTCNRVEFYFVSSNINLACKELISLLSIQKNVSEQLISELLHTYDANHAIQHLFEVACGIQSMVLGENEILGQIKEAYDASLEVNLTDALLNKCFQTAIAVGKRARSETTISRGAYSVSSIAIEAIRQHRLDYFGKSICILGAGTMGNRCLKKLHALGHPNLTISNRTMSTAQSLATEHQATCVDYNKIFSDLHNFDIIIAAVAVQQPIIFKKHLNLERSPLLIDLGLPRNIDPELDKHTDIKLINVDGLKDIASKNINRRQGELSKVNGIVDEEMHNLNQWYTNRNKHRNTIYD